MTDPERPPVDPLREALLLAEEPLSDRQEWDVECHDPACVYADTPHLHDRPGSPYAVHAPVVVTDSPELNGWAARLSASSEENR